MADRVCLLNDGRVQQYAPPQEVFDRPANRFVAEFVGNPPMNVLDVALDPERAGVVVAGSRRPARRPVRAPARPPGSPTWACGHGISNSFPRGPPAPCPAACTWSSPSVTRCSSRSCSARHASRSARREAGRRRPGFARRRARRPGARVLLHPGRHDRRPSIQRRTARSATKWKGFCHDRQSARQPSGRPAAGPRRRQLPQPASRCSARAAADPADQAAAPHRPRAARARPQRWAASSSSARSRTARSRRSSRRSCPMFEQATGTKVQFLTEPYDSFFAKAFQDGQSKAGQYDIYIMDDPWIPQYAAAGILEDLGAARHHRRTRLRAARSRTSATGRRRRARGSRASRTTQPKLIALPTIGDLQTLTYRNDVFPAAPATWDDLVSSGKAGVAARQGQVRLRVPRGEGQPDRHLVLPDLPLVRRGHVRRQVEPDLQLGRGQGGGRLLRGHAEVDRPAGRRRVRLRPGGRGDPRRRRGGDHPVLGQRHQVRRPGGVQGGRQARLRRRPQAGDRRSPRSASSSTASRRRRRTRTTRSRS